MLKITVPMPSPFGYCALVPTTCAVTTTLDGLVPYALPSLLSEVQETKANSIKLLMNIFICPFLNLENIVFCFI
jgi:hypothetical protein